MHKYCHSFCLLLFSLFMLSCAGLSGQDEHPEPLVPGDLTLEEKVGQVMMITVPGKKMNGSTLSLLRRVKPGGVILFGYNVGSASELKAYTAAMQRTAVTVWGEPLLISVDQEGGRVHRIEDGVTAFPGNMAAGVAGDDELTYLWGRVLGAELRALGVNMNLAPDVDVNINPANPVINTRSFGSDTSLVTRMGRAYIRGLQESRCMAVAKHFPGHGDTAVDSHHALPVIRHDMARLRQVELPPFSGAVEEGVTSIMTAHIAYPAIDDSFKPATVSPFFLTEILRKEMGFDGLIMTDAMEMKGISGSTDIARASIEALNAGADIILVTSYGETPLKIHRGITEAVRNGEIPESRLDDAVRRVFRARRAYGLRSMEQWDVDSETAKVLQRADEINRQISRKGILLHGKALPVSSKKPVFYSTSSRFRQLAAREGLRVFPSLAAALQAAEKEGTVAVHFHRALPGQVRAIQHRIESNGRQMVAVITGNPFPVTMASAAECALLTFSDTDQSMSAAASVLAGKAQPSRSELLRLKK